MLDLSSRKNCIEKVSVTDEPDESAGREARARESSTKRRENIAHRIHSVSMQRRDGDMSSLYPEKPLVDCDGATESGQQKRTLDEP